MKFCTRITLFQLLLFSAFSSKAQLFVKGIDTIPYGKSQTEVLLSNDKIFLYIRRFYNDSQVIVMGYDKSFKGDTLQHWHFPTGFLRTSLFAKYKNEFYCMRGYGNDSTTLWKTDGTRSGSGVIVNFDSLAFGRSPLKFYRDRVFFEAAPTGGHNSLWSFDLGSHSLKKVIDSVSSFGNFLWMGGKLFLYDTWEDQVFMSDGTLKGSKPILSNIAPPVFKEFSGFPFIMWQSRLAQLDTLTGDTNVIFGNKKWERGVQSFMQFNSYILPKRFSKELSGFLDSGYVFKNGSIVKDKHGMYLPHFIDEKDRIWLDLLEEDSIKLGEKHFFGHDDGVHGAEPWVTDLTKEGTYMVKNVNHWDNGSPSGGFVVPIISYGNGLLYKNGGGFRGLYFSDGTRKGTKRLSDYHSVQSWDGTHVAWNNGAVVAGHWNRNHILRYYSQEGTPIEATIYHDLNGNGQRDSGEPGAFRHQITLSPGNTILSSDNEGNVYGYVENKDYTAQILLHNDWKLTSPNASFKLKKDSLHLSQMSFGIQPKKATTDFDLTLSVRRTHCTRGRTGISVTNTGTQMAKSLALMQLAPGCSIKNANHPYTVDTAGIITFQIDSLSPNFSENISVNYNLSGVAGNDILKHRAWLTSDTLEWKDSVLYFATCSFDPNDKAVEPIGPREDYTLMPKEFEKLRYTIRFQNLGTDTAYDVTVYDTLHSALDPTTLELESSSHSATFTIAGDIVKFYFKDINLPDSTTDSTGSNGSLVFSVKPKANYLHKTEISNMAGIVFDVNTPVITNTTRSVLLRSLQVVRPTILEGKFIKEDAVNVLWTGIDTHVDSLVLERSIGDSLNFKSVFRSGSKDLSFEDQNVDKSNSYYYRLRAFNAYETATSYAVKVSFPVGRLKPETRQFELYPNPASSVVNLELPTGIESGALTVYDQHGRVVFSQRIQKSAQVDVEHLSKGIYQFEVKSAHFIQVQQIRIE